MGAETKTTPKLALRVISSQGSLVHEKVFAVTLPGLHGDFTVLPQHHETVAHLRSDVGKYSPDGERQYLSIHGGVATVREDRVEVFSPVCERAEDVDVQRAEAARQRAEQRLAEKQEDIDIERARAALYRSLIRLEAVNLLRRK